MQNVNPSQESFRQYYEQAQKNFQEWLPAALNNNNPANNWDIMVNAQQNEERILIQNHSQMFEQLKAAQYSPQQLQQISQQMQNELQELRNLHQSQQDQFKTFQEQIQEQLAEKRKPLEEQQQQELEELLKKQAQELDDFLKRIPPPTPEEIEEFKRQQQMQRQQLQMQHQNQLSQLEAAVRQSVTQQWQQQTQTQTSPSTPTQSQGPRYWDAPSSSQSQPQQPSYQEQPQQSSTTTQPPQQLEPKELSDYREKCNQEFTKWFSELPKPLDPDEDYWTAMDIILENQLDEYQSMRLEQLKDRMSPDQAQQQIKKELLTLRDSLQKEYNHQFLQQAYKEIVAKFYPVVATTVAIPQIGGSVTNTFDPQKNITEKGFISTGMNYTFNTVTGKEVDPNKQTEITTHFNAIEKSNFEKYISKHDKYQMYDGHIVYKTGDGKQKISEGDLNSLREEYMEKGRTKENLSTTANEYAKQNNLTYKFNFQDPRPVPKSVVEIVVNTEMSPTPISSTPTFGGGKH